MMDLTTFTRGVAAFSSPEHCTLHGHTNASRRTSQIAKMALFDEDVGGCTWARSLDRVWITPSGAERLGARSTRCTNLSVCALAPSSALRMPCEVVFESEKRKNESSLVGRRLTAMDLRSI